MDMRQKLMNSEIQNLGQMVQIISYELTVLNDFLKEKFGSSLDTFRAKHAAENGEEAGAFIRSPHDPNPKPTSSMSKSSLNQERIIGEGTNHDPITPTPPTQVKGEVGEAIVGQPMENYYMEEPLALESDPIATTNHHDNADYAEDEDNLNTTNHELGANFPAGSVIIDPIAISPRPGKRKAIWNKFIVARLPNQKLAVKCQICLRMVSNKVDRLEKHYEKCTRGGYSQYLTYNNESTRPNPVRNPVQGQTSSVERTRSGKNRGKHLDEVWKYFDVTEITDPGKPWKKKKVKCKKCNREVSPKVERVRHHFMVCQGLIAPDNDMDFEDGAIAGTSQSIM